MTTPATKTEPIYIEVPAQRVFKFIYVTSYAGVAAFALAAVYLFKDMPFLFEYGVGGAVALMLLLAFVLERKIDKKVRSEFKEQAGLSLPKSFDPQFLPRNSFRRRVVLLDQSDAEVEWTAARNGTFFRFAPV
jgi:hypothetical protein